MFFAVPPEPVAPFGDVNFFPGPSYLVSGNVGLLCTRSEVLARAVQRIPGGVVFVVPDPNRKIVIDPTAGEQVRQRVARGMLLQVIAQPDGLNAFGARAAFIQSAQKRHAALGIMLPAVFAVENHAHQHRLLVIDRLADVAQVTEKVVRGLGALTPLVMETDHVAQAVIAENDGQLMVAAAHAVWPIEVARIANVAMLIAA